MAQNQPEIAEGIADAAEVFGVPVIAFFRLLRPRSLPVAASFSCEFYVDIDYGDDGRQIISREHPADLGRRVAEKVRRAIDLGLARAVSGKDVRVVAD